MYKDIVQKAQPEFARTIEHVKGELGKIRTGQASPALISDVEVDVFGQKMPLKQLAAISVPEPRQLLVSPWEHSYVEPIEKALQAASLGTAPVVEKDAVRITLPQLTEEYRERLGKTVSQLAEEGKQALRKWRDGAWSGLQEAARNGEISEDDKFRGKEELQEATDKAVKEIDEAAERKRRELAN